MKMFDTKILLFFVFLTFYKVQAEIEDTDGVQNIVAVSTTKLPIVLQISQSKQANGNEILQSVTEKTLEFSENQVIKSNISNDIEVFDENNGPHKEKQEEEPVEEEETPSDAEPADEEEDKAPPQPEDEAAPAAEGETPPETESANEPAADAEEPKNEEAPAETNNEPEAAAEDGKENTQPTDGETAGNDEAEMPNDEPAKEGENEQPDSTKAVDTKDLNQKETTCFTCTSNEDAKCALKATKQIKCPKVNEGDKEKHNGCYTLHQVDTNTTMRGCVDDLAEGGLRFCLTTEKLCNLCYTNNCNDKPAPSTAIKLQLNIYTLLILNVSSFLMIKFASLKYN